MNYLAHLHLAGDEDASKVGNLIADMVKGQAVELLPADVQQGVKMHRKLDRYTDSHRTVQTSIQRISAEWGWFSGIMIDVYFDHLLATTWPIWSDESLRHFTQRMYDVLQSAAPMLPADAAFHVCKLIETDRLMSYATVDGIADTLARLSDRIAVRMPQNARRLEHAMPLLTREHDGLRDDFSMFYPEIITYAASLRECRRGYVPGTCATVDR